MWCEPQYVSLVLTCCMSSTRCCAWRLAMAALQIILPLDGAFRPGDLDGTGTHGKSLGVCNAECSLET